MPLFTSTSQRIVVFACAIGVLTGCSHDGGVTPSTTEQSAVAPQLPPKVTVTVVTPADPTRSLSPTFAQTETGDLTTSFDEMASTLPAGEVGIALFNGQQVTQYGSWTSGAAWSTIKVPLSIAALTANQSAAEPLMQQVISQSDNAAADQMWSMLGAPNAAAAAMDAVLREGKDTTSIVQSQQVRPPYSPYGQTQWSKDQVAIFAFELPCVAGTAPVLEQMRNLGGNQQWGLHPSPT